MARLARRQHGFVTREQLLAIGLTSGDVRQLVHTVHLIRVYAGVYAVGHIPVSPVARAAGAVLACGPRAALSHGSAAALWGFVKEWRMPYEVTAPTDHRREGIVAHRLKLLRRDVTVELGVRVTSAARTILDCAPRHTDRQLARMVNGARLARRLYLDQLADVIERFPCHAGAARLKPHVERAGNPTRSTFEDDFLGFCERFGLPVPELNALVCGYEVDAWYEAERLVVELDGWDVHRSRAVLRGRPRQGRHPAGRRDRPRPHHQAADRGNARPGGGPASADPAQQGRVERHPAFSSGSCAAGPPRAPPRVLQRTLRSRAS